MEKIIKLNNLLIKRNLLKFLNKKGIYRVNKIVFGNLESYFLKEMDFLADMLKQEMVICGKKTLDSEVLAKVLKEIED
jgi:hypothetical protein